MKETKKILIFDFRDRKYIYLKEKEINFIAPEMFACVQVNSFEGFSNLITYQDGSQQKYEVTKQYLDSTKLTFNKLTFDNIDKQKRISHIKTTILITKKQYDEIIKNITEEI